MNRLQTGILFTACLVFRLIVVANVQAQSPAAGRPEFDVASIRLNDSGDARIIYRLGRSGIFSANNAPLRFLITLAYQIADFQIFGGPAWLGTERYNIEAKAEGISNPDQMLPHVACSAGRSVQTGGPKRDQTAIGLPSDCGERRAKASDSEGGEMLRL
jgi:hypothetical protein